MTGTPTKPDWRDQRRQSARAAIVAGAWELVHEDNLGSLNIRDLAKRVGITTPTIYAYFESKHAIYDAMFGQAAGEFEQWMAEDFGDEPREAFAGGARRFVQFCVTDTARYQLLFQRVVPDFEPSAESFAPAVRVLEGARTRLAAVGVTAARHVDVWTAIITGLVDQQISNDPGGERWSRLLDEVVDMFLAHAQLASAKRPAPRRRRT